MEISVKKQLAISEMPTRDDFRNSGYAYVLLPNEL